MIKNFKLYYHSSSIFVTCHPDDLQPESPTAAFVCNVRVIFDQTRRNRLKSALRLRLKERSDF